ncbi:MAG TPA: EamA family transporter [Actinoplanes sp.]|nr:EamA family transporter [Actinoplanes sp.]
MQPLLITALTPAVWGTTYAVTTELLPPGRPLLSGLLRALPAGLLLLAATRTLPHGSWWWRSAMLGTLNIGVFFTLLFAAAYRLPGGMAAVLGAAQPLVVAGLTVLLLTERVKLRTVVAGVLGAGGVALAVLTASARLDAIGILAGLAGTMSMALGLTLTKRWGRPEVSLLTATGWQLTAGGLFLVPLVVSVEGLPHTLTVSNLAGYAYLSLVGTLLAYTVWFWGLERLPAANASLLGLLSPLVATVVGWAVLGQALTPVQIAGMMLAFGAVVWGQRQGSRAGGSAKVAALDDVAAGAFASHPEHGAAEPVGAGHVARRDPVEHGQQRASQRVDGVVPADLGTGAVRGPDDAGPERVSLREHLDDRVLGPALHPLPHLAAGRVGPGAGDVDEGQLGIQRGERTRRRDREVVADPGVRGLVHADRRRAEAVEACVGAG